MTRPPAPAFSRALVMLSAVWTMRFMASVSPRLSVGLILPLSIILGPSVSQFFTLVGRLRTSSVMSSTSHMRPQRTNES